MRTLLTIAIALWCALAQGQSIAIPGSSVQWYKAASSGVAITNTTSGLVNWWKLDENAGTTAADSAGTDAGTLSNAGGNIPSWVTGQINSALSFDGIGGYVQLATNVRSGPFTFSSWVFMTNGQNGTIIYDSDNDGTHGWFIWVTNGVSINARVPCTTTDLETAGAAIVPTNSWFHILATWDGVTTTASSFHIYTNGVEVGNYIRRVNGVGTTSANTTSQRQIGNGSTGAQFKWAGKIDDPRIWNRVLNAGEIANMYQWRGQP